MNEKLRRELIELGVPAERHDPSSLAALFPPEFKVSDSHLDGKEIANVLVAFLKRGLFTLQPEARPEGVARRAHGAHVCHFYRDQPEMLAVVSAFLAEGLRSGTRCLWVLYGGLTIERAREAMSAARAGLEDAEASGRLAFLTESQVYLAEDGSLRPAAAIIDFWLQQEAKARQQGFTGIRITGDGTAFALAEGWGPGLDYEQRVDVAFRGRRVSALCTYSLATVDPERLAQALSGHAGAWLRRRDGYDLVREGPGVENAIRLLRDYKG
jgi:hypothetical protein